MHLLLFLLLQPTNAQLISYVSQQSLCVIYSPTCFDIFMYCKHPVDDVKMSKHIGI